MSRAKRGLIEYLNLKRRLRSDMTAPEKRLWFRLRARQLHGFKFRRQHGIGPYIVDFYCPELSLVVEVDGDNHAEAEQVRKDQLRDEYLQSIGLKVVRYRNAEVIENLDGVLHDLLKQTSPESTSPNPSLIRRGKDDQRI